MKNVNEGKQNPVFAVLDSDARNRENVDLWPSEKRRKAFKCIHYASNAYYESRVFLNFRKKSITVKVENPHQNSTATQDLDEWCKQNAVQVENYPGKIMFRIK